MLPGEAPGTDERTGDREFPAGAGSFACVEQNRAGTPSPAALPHGLYRADLHGFQRDSRGSRLWRRRGRGVRHGAAGRRRSAWSSATARAAAPRSACGATSACRIPRVTARHLRCMKIAEKFGRPVISLIDLPGAYPGLGAEERGQAEAIARNIREMSRLRVPTISVISGEGGSGGALALAVSDRVLILENALYFVITPGVLRSHHVAGRVAQATGCRSHAHLRAGGGRAGLRGRDHLPSRRAACIPITRRAPGCWAACSRKHLAELKAMPIDALVAARQQKFRKIAQFYTEG